MPSRRRMQECRASPDNLTGVRNTLYYGDNLPLMREHIADESVDLVYLDPPFNSQRDYNVLFKQDKKGEHQAQMIAFTDTWDWAPHLYDEFFGDPRNAKLFDLMQSLYRILGGCEMMAYLLMMSPRLLELHRVLKPTGSFYLHCDPVASHYLKMVLDGVFGPAAFGNEIVWQRTNAKGVAFTRFARNHDIILRYSKSATWTWNALYTPHNPGYVEKFYRFEDPETGRRYQLADLTNPNKNRPNLTYEFLGVTRVWRWTKERMHIAYEAGDVVQEKPGTVPRLKRYLDEQEGNPVGDIWTDIRPIQAGASEGMGYPTQKPLALLERIINASSKPDDLVLDPFCGCGTAVVAAERLGRKWIGIDITFVAVDVMIKRLAKDFGLKRDKDYDVKGDPFDAGSARKLFEQSPKQFEIWAVRKVGGMPQPEKSGDKGVDGKVYFGDASGDLQFAVCQVKGGHLTPSAVRDFAHVVEREKAAMGFFICLATPTKGMYNEAEEIGFFEGPSGRKIPKLQIRTIRELLEDKDFDYPKAWSLRSGGKKLAREGEQPALEM
jgi:site-specific DNA-methyltransferase (adenine-specific)